MRKGSLLVILVAVLATRAISQEIVIGPTNGRAQTTNHVSRPAAVESTPARAEKPVQKTKSQERSATKKQAKVIPAKELAARLKAPKAIAVSDAPAAKREEPEVIPATKKAPARPEWATADTREARSLQIEIANALSRDPKLAGSPIQVAVDDTSVTLEGRAAGTEERLQAQRLAQSYAWNRKLVDHIEIVRTVSAQK